MTDYFIDKVMNVGEKFQFITNRYNRYAILDNDFSKLTQKLYNTLYKSSMIDSYLPEVHGGSKK